MILLFYILHIDTYIILKLSLYPYGASILRGPKKDTESSVDLRRIQITGGSSFMITLPKDWADSVGLKKNDTVGLQPQPDGSMVIYPGGEQAALAGSTKIIDADGITDRDYLYRQLVGAYIAGHDVIELRSEGELSSMVASTASSFTQTAIGLGTSWTRARSSPPSPSRG